MFLALRVRHPAAPPARQRSLPGRATCPALKPRQAAEPPLFPGFLLYVLYVLYLTRQAAEPPLSHVLYLTRQAAEPPLSPGSLLYVLYVLYILYARNLYYMCYTGPYSTNSTYSKEPGESGCSVACLVRYSTYSTYSKDPGESGCSVACLVRYSTYSTYSKEPGDCEVGASRPRLPGIGALPSPRQGRDSSQEKIPVLVWGEDCSTLFFCQWLRGPSCPA